MDKKLQNKTNQVLERLGLKEINPGATTGTEWFETKGKLSASVSPIDGNEIARIQSASIVSWSQSCPRCGFRYSGCQIAG